MRISTAKKRPGRIPRPGVMKRTKLDMDWKLLATTFGTLFVAELGDKTQLACILLTSKTEKPWTVLLGSSLALVLVSALGVAFASFICQYIPADVVKKVAAVGFVIIGVLIYFDKL